MATTRKTTARKSASRKGAARKAATTDTAPRGAKARAKAAPRDSDGRFKADHHVRNAAFGATAALGAVAAGVAAAFKFGLLDRFLPRQEGHEAEDLLLDAADQRGNDAGGDRAGGDRGAKPRRRAPAAFRPDIDAPMTAAEKEALRPAEGHAPGFAADRNSTVA